MRPNWIELDLSELRVGVRIPFESCRRAFASSDRALDAIGRCGGEALAFAVLAERPETSFVLAVGDAVRRGLPSAARATIVARSPLSRRLADGQVGSDLARRFASIASALAIRGRGELALAVLVVDDDGLRIEDASELAGLDPRSTHAALEARFGECATLSIGIAGEREIPIANLAACSSGSGANALPHFVGRGGLGAVLGRVGLKAIAVRATASEPEPAPELVRAMLASPRLAVRADRGTFELAESFAARGDLHHSNHSRDVSVDVARDFAREIASLAKSSHGCRGCPTPCGLVFEGARGERQGGRFSASYALGFDLGFERAEDSLALLALCDRFGLDAKELGASLALAAAAKRDGGFDDGPKFGDRAAFERAIGSVVERRELGALLALGAEHTARKLRVDVRSAKGQAVRLERNLAALLGQCVSSRGTDPMRTFPFLAADQASRARLERLLAPLELPPNAEDPAEPSGKGRLVFWHENLAAALDAVGFCAFSAGALLADGEVELDLLARWILPDELESQSHGAALIEFGDRLVSLARDLDRRFSSEVDRDRPLWARAELDRVGMYDEYRALRELDASGLEAGAVPIWRRAPSLDRRIARLAPNSTSASRVEPESFRGRGRVLVRSFGPLERVLGAELELEVEFPTDVAALIELASSRSEDHRRALGSRAAPTAVVFRDGKRLGPNAGLRPGDRLDLVVAIGGG